MLRYDELNPINLDSSWMDYIGDFTSMSGTLLSIGALLAVGGFVTGVVGWAISRAAGVSVSGKGVRRFFAAVVGAVILGALAGMVGFGYQFSITF